MRARPSLPPDRRTLGALGEALACRMLVRHGMVVMARNLAVGRGEIDVVARDGRTLVAVEVRSRRRGDPLDAFGDPKHRQVAVLARLLDPPCGRVDLVAVRFGEDAVELRWVPGIG